MKTVEPIMSSYLHQKGIERGLAVSGAFEITSRCNFNCSMCYVHNETQDALSAEQWLNLGSQARDAGLLFLLITGGEPLLREDFEKIYLGLQKLGFMISINTNGSLIKKYILLFKNIRRFALMSLFTAAVTKHIKGCAKTRALKRLPTI